MLLFLSLLGVFEDLENDAHGDQCREVIDESEDVLTVVWMDERDHIFSQIHAKIGKVFHFLDNQFVALKRCISDLENFVLKHTARTSKNEIQTRGLPWWGRSKRPTTR